MHNCITPPQSRLHKSYFIRSNYRKPTLRSDHLSKMTYTKENSFFVCHRCLHTFYYKADVKRHLSKQKICDPQYNCLISNQEILLKSTHKRFYFPGAEIFPPIKKHHLLCLVSDYHQEINVIPNLSILNIPKNRPDLFDHQMSLPLTNEDYHMVISTTDDGTSDLKDSTCNSVAAQVDATDYKIDEIQSALPEESIKMVQVLFDKFIANTKRDNASSSLSLSPDGSDHQESDPIDQKDNEVEEDVGTLLMQSLIDLLGKTTCDQSARSKGEPRLRNKNHSVISNDDATDNATEDGSEADSISAYSDKVSVTSYMITEDGKPTYQCEKCDRVFTRKDNFNRHVKNTKSCSEKEAYKKMIIATSQKQINNNIYNISNSQTINNSGVNNYENKIEVKVRDFFGAPFEYIHIPNELVRKKDFFLHHNFIPYVFENDANKNIYFENGYAFIYTNKGIIRIPSEKGVYMILEKLDSTIGSYLRTNSLINPDDYAFVIWFYSVVRNKYLTDSIYREYDVETHQFFPFETKNIRTRDKYMSEVIKIVNAYKGRIMEILQPFIDNNNGEIDTNYKLNIPYYESSRMRNKGFEEKY